MSLPAKRARAEARQSDARRRTLLEEIRAALEVVAANLGVLVEETPEDDAGRHMKACAERTEKTNERALALVARLLDATER